MEFFQVLALIIVSISFLVENISHFFYIFKNMFLFFYSFQYGLASNSHVFYYLIFFSFILFAYFFPLYDDIVHFLFCFVWVAIICISCDSVKFLGAVHENHIWTKKEENNLKYHIVPWTWKGKLPVAEFIICQYIKWSTRIWEKYILESQ